MSKEKGGKCGRVGVDRASGEMWLWIGREVKFEGGQGGNLNAGRQLTNDEMWGGNRAHLEM